ncbi:MAG: membrane protein insertase YidC [Candidatus Omnitrophica bacterium]|nr:membrane protein insertase YidC [Candidatus Omnitrophota bacterium]
MNQEPNLDKNYWLALIFLMLVFMGYPYFLKWINPPAPQPEAIQVQEPVVKPNPQIASEQKPISAPEGPFLEKPIAPSVLRFENDLYETEFSTLGGTVTRLWYKGEGGKEAITHKLFYESVGGNEPGLFGIRLVNEDADLTRTVFKLNRSDKMNGLFEFVFEKQGEYRITKEYEVDPEKPVIHLRVLVENLSVREKHFPLEIHYGMLYGQVENLQHEMFEGVVSTSEKIETRNQHDIAKKGFSVSKEILWAGYIRKYFALLIKPDYKAIANEAHADQEKMEADLRLEPISLGPGSRAEQSFLIYAGPQRYETLKSFNVGFEDVLSRGFFGLFKIWFLRALKYSHQYTRNFGWDIIILTLILKLLFTPLTHISFESMKRMQALQPKLKSLQERYKKDPARLNKEMMELYRRNRVNPMAGCLPMVFQIPVFIAFYQVLNEAIELKGAPFIFWIHDLSEPDRLFQFSFNIPFLGDAFNLLPLLMIGSMVWQQKLTPQSGATPEQTKMFAFMPVIFGFIFYKMPSGLVLYWFLNNMLSIIHQTFVKRMVIVLHHEDQSD